MSSHGRELDQVCGVCHQCRLANHRELMLMLDRPRVAALEILGGSVRISSNRSVYYRSDPAEDAAK